MWVHYNSRSEQLSLGHPIRKAWEAHSHRERQSHRGAAQSLERRAWDPEVAGENPAAPTISHAAVAEIDEAFVF